VPVVQRAAQAQSPLGVALLLAVAMGGCGGKSSTPTAPPTAAPATTAASSGHQDLGVDVQLADCIAWNRGDDQARRGTIHEIETFAGGPVGSPNGHGPILPVDVAYRLFARYCANDFASHFKLYKLYTRAAAFTPRN
jgi:hypothetical protein